MRARRVPGAELWLGLLVVGLAMLLPATASACGSCFLESEFTRRAYYGTTLLMIAVPLLLAGGIAVWLRRAARRSEAARSPELDGS